VDRHARGETVTSRREIRKRVEELLASEPFAVLATDSGTGPYTSLVAFWAPEDLTHIVFATLRKSRKFKYLNQRPQVALHIDDRPDDAADLAHAASVTAIGMASELTADGRWEAEAKLLARHPSLTGFVAQSDCTIVRVDIDTYHVVSNFQDVIEIAV